MTYIVTQKNLESGQYKYCKMCVLLLLVALLMLTTFHKARLPVYCKSALLKIFP